MNYKKSFDKTIDFLDKKKKILFLTTSNRWEGDKELPKSTILAQKMAEKLRDKVTIIDVTKLKIYVCEGNNSTRRGNTCGVKDAVLKDKKKNPSGCHRCWASINHKDDELWKISRELFRSEAVVFFGPIRWGQMNSVYQKLIERLNWIDVMHSTFGEKSPVKKIAAGLIVTGHNWNGANVVKTQRKVLGFYGFQTPKELFWNWQFTNKVMDETNETYKKAYPGFLKDFGFIGEQ